MKHARLYSILGLTALLLAGCIELTSQRISWFHDEKKDTLKILIFYDGLHESDRNSDKGVEQLPKFIKDGDIMFLDWFGHIKMGRYREWLKTGNFIQKMAAKFFTSVQTQPVGHYRDPDGHIGALQLVTIPKVSRFIRNLNTLVNIAVTAGQLSLSGMPKTMDAWRVAANKQHKWVVLDGHAIRIRFPMPASEASIFKERFLMRFYNDLQDDDNKDISQRIARQLAQAPVSLIQKVDEITVVLGYKKQPGHFRMPIRDDYDNSLEQTVTKHVPNNLDHKLAIAMIQQATATEASAEKARPAVSGLMNDLIAWGPPEVQVGAVLRTIKDGLKLPGSSADETKQQALLALRKFGKAWNEAANRPAAPQPNDDPEAYCGEWAEWQMLVSARKNPEKKK